MTQKIIFAIAAFLISNAQANCHLASAPLIKNKQKIELTLWNAKEAHGILSRPEALLNSTSDLYFFQEVNQEGLDLIQTEQTHRNFVQNLHNKKKFGVGILSAMIPCDQYTREVDDEPVMSKIDKGLVIQFYKFKQSTTKILKVINVHLPLFMGPSNYGNGAYKRALKTLSDEVQSHKGPLLIAGDFNGWSPSRMAYLLPQFVKDNQLDELTFNNNSGNRAAILYLDRVFSKDLEISGQETITDIDESDHYLRKIEISVSSFFNR